MSEETTVELTRGQRYRRGLGRFLRALVRVITFLVLIAVIAGAGWLIFQELQRSFAVVTDRIERNSSTIGELQREVDGLEDTLSTRDAEVALLAATLQAEDERLVADMLAIAAAGSGQDVRLDAIEQQFSDNLTTTLTLSETIAVLNAGLFALQGDLITLGSDVDALGGELDGLAAELAAVDSSVGTLATDFANSPFGNGDIEKIELTLTLFRAWEHLIRAQLRLAEGNLGLASEDIDQAGQIISLALALPAAPEELETARLRIIAAQNSLPDEPQIARVDVAIAWQLLDEVLAQMLFDGQLVIAAPAVQPTPVATSAPTSEAPTATPIPEATPASPPEPTPTPDNG